MKIMRRAKLAPGSVPSGSLPTTSCHAIPRCFVCDELIKSHRVSTSLLGGRTQYTHSPLPTKIGGYIGDEFVVVVTPQDALCKHCMALINTMDRLELELRQHRYTLTRHLKTKYKLDGYISKQISKTETGEVQDLPELEIIDVSDEEWTPNKRQRTEAVKHHHCTICNVSFSNLNIFMAHLSHHKQSGQMADTTGKASISGIVDKVTGQITMFKCGCCSESFASKDSLAQHMQLHTGYHSKSKGISAATSIESKKIEAVVPVRDCIPTGTVEAQALYEDIEQLAQPEAPLTVGECSEQQKGRVCLLALLNNGVCSDVSHRIPIDCSDKTPYQPLSVSNVLKEAVTSDKNNDCVNVCVKASLPIILNENQLTEQKSHLSNVAQDSNSMVLNSSPLNLNSSEIQSEKVTPALESASLNESKDMQNLTNSSCLKTSEINIEIEGNSNQFSTKHPLRNQVIPKRKSNNQENIVHDMPSLIDEELEQNDGNIEANLIQISNVYTKEENQVGSSALPHSIPSEPQETAENKEVQMLTDTNVIPPSSDENKKMSESMKNIAIVSVTSLEMNRNSFEDIGNNWFYASSGEDLLPSSDKATVNEVDSCLQGPWLSDSDQYTASGRNFFSENCNPSEYSISNDSCVTAQIIPEDGSAAEDQEITKKLF